MILRGVDRLGAKLPNDLIGCTNVIGMRMGANEEVEIVLGHTNLMHSGNHLVVYAKPHGNSIPERIGGIRTVWVIPVLPRVNHAKPAV